MKFQRSRSRRRLDPSQLRLPLIALIDVVLFLLFYFIIAGNLAAEESELASTLAIAGTGSSSGFLESQVLRISAETAKNELTGKDELRPVFKIGAHALTDRKALFELLRTLPKEAGVVVRADDQVDLQSIATALQIAKDAGFTKITYVPTK